jgi:hypothetical protein
VQRVVFTWGGANCLPSGWNTPPSPLLAGQRQSLYGLWLWRCRRGSPYRRPRTADYHRAAARKNRCPTTTARNGRFRSFRHRSTYTQPGNFSSRPGSQQSFYASRACHACRAFYSRRAYHGLRPGLYLTGHRSGHCANFYCLLWPVGHGRLYYAGNSGMELPAAVAV